MDAKIQLIAEQYGVNSWLFSEAMKNITDEQVKIRPRDKGNSILWTAGHVANSRFFLGNLLGLEDKFAWDEMFSRGSKILDDDKYPSMDEIKKSFEDISAKLMARFEVITDEELQADHNIPFPIQDKSLRGAICFMSLHESYHMGQFSYIRKLLGLDGLTG